MIEHSILSNLVYNRDYCTSVIPHIKKEYFTEKHNQVVFELISGYMDKYSKIPTREALFIELDRLPNISDEIATRSEDCIRTLSVDETNLDYLVDVTEDYCKKSAYNNALAECIILSEKGNEGRGPEIMQKALAISFKTNIGHDYVDDAKERFKYYHSKENKVDIYTPSVLSRITKGGFSKKTLNIFVAGTHIGKTAFMAHLAADNILNGNDVLYITLEMRSEEIGRRVDCNLLNLNFDDLQALSEEEFEKRFNRLAQTRITGRLKVVEYANGSLTANHIRALLKELKTKENFSPSIIYIDYLNLMNSSKFKDTANSNKFVQSIAEETRALAQEEDVAVVSATQLNRSGAASADPDMTQTADSWGLPMTVDFMAVLFTNDDLRRLKQMVMKIEKNRYGGVDKDRKTLIGFDSTKQQIYDLEETAHSLLTDDEMDGEPMFDHDEETGEIRLREQLENEQGLWAQ